MVFHDPELLTQALVHPSYVNEHPEAGVQSNQRLEFLGDAVVDLVVAEEVCQRFPSAAEGQLTVLRAAVVSDECAARVGERLGLGRLLLLGQGEEATGGRARSSNLADVFEALVGALFVDQGYDAARRVLLGLLAEELRALSLDRALDSKSQLQEMAQRRSQQLVYRIVREEGPEHQKQFEVEALFGGEVVGTGRGRRKAEAEREAAEQAMATLRKRGEPGQTAHDE